MIRSAKVVAKVMLQFICCIICQLMFYFAPNYYSHILIYTSLTRQRKTTPKILHLTHYHQYLPKVISCLHQLFSGIQSYMILLSLMNWYIVEVVVHSFPRERFFSISAANSFHFQQRRTISWSITWQTVINHNDNL